MLSKTIIVALKDNEDQIGYCISEQILTIQSINENTKKLQSDFVAKLGVCWEDEDKRCPAIEYHDPEDLIWLDIDGLTLDETIIDNPEGDNEIITKVEAEEEAEEKTI